MPISNAIVSFRSRLLNPVNWEQDVGFAETLLNIMRRGLLAAGTLLIHQLITSTGAEWARLGALAAVVALAWFAMRATQATQATGASAD